MNNTRTNITKLYAFSFLQMTLFPMAIITLFWKDRIGLSLTQILLLQGILSIVMVVMEYPKGRMRGLALGGEALGAVFAGGSWGTYLSI